MATTHSTIRVPEKLASPSANYYVMAATLKAFSSCPPSRAIYRALGNQLGARRRRIEGLPRDYITRAQRNVAFIQKYAPDLGPNDMLIELGTGWAHWEALSLRLFYPFRAILYDVDDNRQWPSVQPYIRQLAECFDIPGFLEGVDFDRARYTVRKIDQCSGFEDLYSLLGFRYRHDRGRGLMDGLPPGSFRVSISAGVMEHLPHAAQWVKRMADLLEDGGVGMHSINLCDHLSLHAQGNHPKQYLAFSRDHWNRWCQNHVQFTNLIQRSEWLNIFSDARLKILEERSSDIALGALPIHSDYEHLSASDLRCGWMQVLVARP